MKQRFCWILCLVGLAALWLWGWPALQATTQLNRIRWLMGAVSIGVALITLLAIRSYKLREKYAVLWLTTSSVIIVAALFPQLMDISREWFGMQYATSMVAVVFVFLVLVSFHFSIALSALNDKASAMASRCAMLEARLLDVEKKVGLVPPGCDPASSMDENLHRHP